MSLAQSPAQPVLWDTLEDGTRFYRVRSNGDTMAAGSFTAGYRFRMFSDSVCVTDYQITGFRINTGRWPLENWSVMRTITAGADSLSDRSRTVARALAAGDTLSFYRDLFWKNPVTNYQDSNNYRSLDTLTYTVELLRAGDGSRIAVLDSLTVLPRVVPGVPIIHGSRPIMARVAWVVPASLGGTEAFMRVRVRARGSASDRFTRVEFPSCSLWLMLSDPHWIKYLAMWGEVCARVRAVED